MGTKHFMSVTVMFSCIVRKACASIDAIFGGLESDINESSWFVKGWSKFYPFKAVIGIDVAFAISFRKWLKHFETSVHQRIQLDALPPSASTRNWYDLHLNLVFPSMLDPRAYLLPWHPLPWHGAMKRRICLRSWHEHPNTAPNGAEYPRAGNGKMPCCLQL